MKRDKVSLDIFWLRDESLEESANLPEPDLIAAEVAEHHQVALNLFFPIATNLKGSGRHSGRLHSLPPTLNSIARVAGFPARPGLVPLSFGTTLLYSLGWSTRRSL